MVNGGRSGGSVGRSVRRDGHGGRNRVSSHMVNGTRVIISGDFDADEKREILRPYAMNYKRKFSDDIPQADDVMYVRCGDGYKSQQTPTHIRLAYRGRPVG